MIDMRCEACEQEFEVLVGGPNRYEAPKECPDCDAPGLRRLWTFEGHVSQTTFMSDAETRLHLRHKRDIERAAASGKLLDFKEGKRNPEFNPQLPKAFH